MQEPIDIIINNYTRLQYLDIIVKAIKERTQYPYRIIVTDNSSTPRTRKFINKLLEDGLIHETVFIEKNQPLPQALEHGMEFIKSKYFVQTVEDTIPPFTNPCWLTHLVWMMDNAPDFGAIALGYNRMSSDKYFKGLENGKAKCIDLKPSLDLLQHRSAIEEFFQIQRTDEMKRVGFGRKNTSIYWFSRRFEDIYNKKVGKTYRDSVLSAYAWDDDDWGYLPEVKNRKQFYDKPKFRRTKIVACLMAHHDDEFIDRVLENIGKYTDEFYINIHNATPYTKNACISHPKTKKYIITTGPWSQAGEREETIRMLDEVEPDIVLFPDSDELYCDDLMDILENFWASHKEACWFEMKYCWWDENHVRLDRHFKKMVHVRAFKWKPNITYEPYGGFACPNNFRGEKHRKFLSKSPVKHLKFLKKENKEQVEKESKEKELRVQKYDKFDSYYGE